MKINTENSTMWDEIHQQPEVINNVLSKNKETFKSIAKEVKERNIETVMLVGRGSSEHACQVAKYLFETEVGMLATIASPSVITRYNSNIDLSKTLTIGVSQSGGAKDVYEVMKRCDDSGGICVSVTNNPDSIMANIGKYRLNLECGEEISLTATKSYMSQLTILVAIASYISEKEELIDQLSQYSTVVEETLEFENQIKEIIPNFRNANKILVLSRGLLHALGLETELKIQETSYLDARAYATSDYIHGPVATTERFVPIIFFIADEKTDESSVELHARLKEEYKIYSLIITNKKAIADKANTSILLPKEFDGMLAVYASAVISQMFSCLLSISRGYDPDNPVGVSKNTVTI